MYISTMVCISKFYESCGVMHALPLIPVYSQNHSKIHYFCYNKFGFIRQHSSAVYVGMVVVEWKLGE